MTSSSIPPPSPARGAKRFGLGALLSAALIGAAISGTLVWLTLQAAAHRDGGAAGGSTHAAAVKYTCPMHPAIVQDHPGDCPICGMKLLPLEPAPTPSAAAPAPAALPSGERRIVLYRSPMDPKQTSPVPRKDEMGMDYLPVYADELPPAPKVTGLSTVEIDPERQQLIGLQTAEVTRGPMGGAWHSVGRVTIDETRVRHVNIKVSGFVERIYVDFIGKSVKLGDPLFSLYSPELLAAQEEYLLALRTLPPGASVDDSPLLGASRRKLALWDVPAKQIDELTRTRTPTKTLTFHSPLSGVVTKKDVVQGMKLDAGAMPYEIVDLSQVWVLIDIYESELRFVKEGLQAKLRLNAFPNREFNGKVVFIDPLLDPRTRTVKVRLTFPNKTGELKPEMFGEAELMGEPHDALSVPLDAVIDSGKEKIVFVASGSGKFEPRRVQLGVSDSSRVEIVSGVSLGERVVTRANFLVDSESRLRASLSQALAPQPELESARVMPATGSPAPGASSRGDAAKHHGP